MRSVGVVHDLDSVAVRNRIFERDVLHSAAAVHVDVHVVRRRALRRGVRRVHVRYRLIEGGRVETLLWILTVALLLRKRDLVRHVSHRAELRHVGAHPRERSVSVVYSLVVSYDDSVVVEELVDVARYVYVLSVYLRGVPVQSYRVSVLVDLHERERVVVVPDVLVVLHGAVLERHLVDVFETLDRFVVLRNVGVHVLPRPASVYLLRALPVSDDVSVVVYDHVQFVLARYRYVVERNRRVELPVLVDLNLARVPPRAGVRIVALGVLVRSVYRRLDLVGPAVHPAHDDFLPAYRARFGDVVAHADHLPSIFRRICPR